MDFTEIMKKVQEVQAIAEKALNQVSALKIDDQMYLHKNKPIVPGIGCKLAYDQNGLIVGVQQMAVSDIPNLTINKIDGLVERLDEISESMSSLNGDINKIKTSMMHGKVVSTGTKVNCDANGHVLSLSNLLPEDVPMLPMDKIEGLTDALEKIRSSIPEPTVSIQQVAPSDQQIRISMSDLPNELVTQLNTIEATFVDYAPKQIVDRIQKELSSKIPMSAKKIRPGFYTSVYVNEHGVVEKARTLKFEDLPDITTRDIKDLDRVLASKVDRQDLNGIQSSIATLLDTNNRIGDILKLKTKLDTVASDADVKKLESEVKLLKGQVDTILSTIPIDGLMSRIAGIEETLRELQDSM